MFAGRAGRRDAAYLVVLGIFLLASDWALAVYAEPRIDPAFGRRAVVALLVALAALGGCAVLLGAYRLVRSPPVGGSRVRR